MCRDWDIHHRIRGSLRNPCEKVKAAEQGTGTVSVMGWTTQPIQINLLEEEKAERDGSASPTSTNCSWAAEGTRGVLSWAEPDSLGVATGCEKQWPERLGGLLSWAQGQQKAGSPQHWPGPGLSRNQTHKAAYATTVSWIHLWMITDRAPACWHSCAHQQQGLVLHWGRIHSLPLSSSRGETRKPPQSSVEHNRTARPIHIVVSPRMGR